MKKKRLENIQTFMRGALFSVLLDVNWGLPAALFAFALFETIWLMMMSFLKTSD